MCGIAGILDVNGTPERDLLQGMANTMCHRGPDGEGLYIDGPVGLGHRRLSIIDLDTGAQPMTNENGSIWITFNGEIYNFRELRQELTDKGHKFRTKSDTETIIHAYEEYGEGCLKKLRGMFAFGIWDVKNRSLFLARDRLGKKPLYYFFGGDRLVFASEMKAILQDKRIKRDLNPEALVDYLTYNYIPFPKTIFKNIYKLPPAHYMTVRIVRDVGNMRNVQDVRDVRNVHNEQLKQTQLTNNTDISNKLSDWTSRTSIVIGQLEHLELSVQQYWDLKYQPDYSVSEEDWVEGLREKLTESVKMRLISDVPLGAFLSGGLDSSSIVAIMGMCSEKQVKTFSIGFDEKDYNEVKYARLVANHFKTDHHEMFVRPDAIELLPKLSWEFDEPFADSSAIPTYYVSKMARKHVTVVLSGDGGDEVFAGYNRYGGALNYQKIDILPLALKKLIFGGVSSIVPSGMKGKGLLRHLSESEFKRYAGMITQDEPGYLESLLSEDVKKEVNQDEDHSFFKQFYDRRPDYDYLTKIQYLDTKTYLAEDILTKVDRASMLCSLETRAPLLDHEIVEFSAKIPYKFKINNGQKKYIFKRAMEVVLPTEILNRTKMGFNVPITCWFKSDLSSYSRNVLLDKKCIERGLFSKKGIEALLHNHKKRGRDLSPKIWALLFFEHWCRNWLDV